MITLPEIPVFENYFSTLTNIINDDIEDYYEISVAEGQHDNLNGSKVLTAKKFFVRRDNYIYHNSVIDKIKLVLNDIDHCNSTEMVNRILYLFSFLPRNEKSVKNMNLLLCSKSKADINQYILFVVPMIQNINLQFGEFTVGTFEHLKFQRHCDSFNTDFYKKYGNDYINKLCASRNYFTIPIIELIKFQDLISNYTEAINEALYLYYEGLAEFYFEDFSYKFEQQQNLLTFINNEFIDLDNFNLTSSPTYISIFKNIANTKNGWIVPSKKMLHIQFGDTGKRYRSLKEKLHTKFKFNGFNDNSLHHTTESFLSFCAKAKRYNLKNLPNESFLHYVIALDLIFGQKGSSTNSVTSRASICVHKSLSQDYHNVVKTMKDIYNERSSYVHAGKTVTTEKLEIVEKICQIVLYTLFKLEDQIKNWELEKWTKQLDVLTAIMETHRLPDDNWYLSAGLLDSSVIITAD